MPYISGEILTIQKDIATRQQSKSYRDIVIHATYTSIPELLAKGDMEGAIRVAEEANIKSNYFQEKGRTNQIVSSFADEIVKAGDTLENTLNHYYMTGKMDLNTYSRLKKDPEAMEEQWKNDEATIRQVNAKNTLSPYTSAINSVDYIEQTIGALKASELKAGNLATIYSSMDKGDDNYLTEGPKAKQAMMEAMLKDDKLKSLSRGELADELDKIYTYINTPASNTVESEFKRHLANSLKRTLGTAGLDYTSDIPYIDDLYEANFAENIRLDSINDVLLGYAGNDDTASQMEVLQRNYFNSSYKESNPQYTGSFEDYMDDETISKPDNKDFELYIKTKVEKDTEQFLNKPKIEQKTDKENRETIPEGLTESQTNTINRLNRKINANENNIKNAASVKFPSYVSGESTGMTNAEVINEYENDMGRLEELKESLSESRESLPSGMFQVDDPYIDELQAEIADIKRKYMFDQSQIYNNSQLGLIRKLIKERGNMLSQNEKAVLTIGKIKAKAVKP